MRHLVNLALLTYACGGELSSQDAGRPAWAPACLSSSAPVLLLSGSRTLEYKLFVDQGYLYWAERTGSRGAVVRVRTSGGDVEQVAQVGGQIALTRDFIVAGTYQAELYVVRRTDGSVRRIGGGISLGHPGAALFFGVDEAAAYVGTGQDILALPFDDSPPRTVATNPGATVLAVDGQHLYGIVFPGAAMFSLPLAGGQPTPLGPVGGPLTLDADYVYFNDGSAVARVAKAGGKATQLAPSLDLLDIAVDDANVFWADGRSINKVPKSGGTPMTLVGQGVPFTVDESCIYWIDQAGVWSERK